MYVASNGEEALKLYLRHPIDVVVTDIQMPRGDGIELISALKGLDPRLMCLSPMRLEPWNWHEVSICFNQLRLPEWQPLFLSPFGPLITVGSAFQDASG
jgi:CheY-like chemotaxis protein